MKYFISYRHTGAEQPRLGNLQNAIKEAFDMRPSDSFYSTYFNQQEFDESGLTAAQIMRHAFEMIDQHEILLVILDSDIKSEGMLIEVGYCLAKDIPIIVAKSKGVKNTYFQDLASQKIDYNSPEELKQKLISM